MAGQIRSLSEDSQSHAQHNAKRRCDHRQERGVDQKLADPGPPDERRNLSPAGFQRRSSHEAKRNERDQRDKQRGGAIRELSAACSANQAPLANMAPLPTLRAFAHHHGASDHRSPAWVMSSTTFLLLSFETSILGASKSVSGVSLGLEASPSPTPYSRRRRSSRQSGPHGRSPI